MILKFNEFIKESNLFRIDKETIEDNLYYITDNGLYLEVDTIYLKEGNIEEVPIIGVNYKIVYKISIEYNNNNVDLTNEINRSIKRFKAYNTDVSILNPIDSNKTVNTVGITKDGILYYDESGKTICNRDFLEITIITKNEVILNSIDFLTNLNLTGYEKVIDNKIYLKIEQIGFFHSLLSNSIDWLDDENKDENPYEHIDRDDIAEDIYNKINESDRIDIIERILENPDCGIDEINNILGTDYESDEVLENLDKKSFVTILSETEDEHITDIFTYYRNTMGGKYDESMLDIAIEKTTEFLKKLDPNITIQKEDNDYLLISFDPNQYREFIIEAINEGIKPIELDDLFNGVIEDIGTIELPDLETVPELTKSDIEKIIS